MPKEEPAREWVSAPCRASEDTEEFRSKRGWFLVVEVVGSGVLSGLAAGILWDRSTLKGWQVGLITFGVFVGGFFIIYGLIFLWNLLRAPYRQRNEARVEVEKLRAPRHEEQDKRLRIHFEEMEKTSPTIFPNIIVDYGKISPLADIPKLPDEFIAHFPDEATKWGKYYQEIKTHNEKHAKFTLKIKQAFEAHGLEVRPSNGPYQSPYIYEMVLQPLFWWWSDHLKHVEHPMVDFTRIEVDFSRPGIFDMALFIAKNIQPNLYVFGCPNYAVARAETEADSDKCKAALRGVANNAEYEHEADNLIESATRLEKSVLDLRGKLASEILSVGRYWPGTKTYTFQSVEWCPVCKDIFG